MSNYKVVEGEARQVMTRRGQLRSIRTYHYVRTQYGEINARKEYLGKYEAIPRTKNSIFKTISQASGIVSCRNEDHLLSSLATLLSQFSLDERYLILSPFEMVNSFFNGGDEKKREISELLIGGGKFHHNLIIRLSFGEAKNSYATSLVNTLLTNRINEERCGAEHLKWWIFSPSDFQVFLAEHLWLKPLQTLRERSQEWTVPEFSDVPAPYHGRLGENPISVVKSPSVFLEPKTPVVESEPEDEEEDDFPVKRKKRYGRYR